MKTVTIDKLSKSEVAAMWKKNAEVDKEFRRLAAVLKFCRNPITDQPTKPTQHNMNRFRLTLALYLLSSLAIVGATILLAIVFEAPWALFLAFAVVLGIGKWIDWEINTTTHKQ